MREGDERGRRGERGEREKVCVCVCVCVSEREREERDEREKERERERERGRGRDCAEYTHEALRNPILCCLVTWRIQNELFVIVSVRYMLQRVTCVAAFCSVLQRVTCVVACCSVLQRVPFHLAYSETPACEFQFVCGL